MILAAKATVRPRALCPDTGESLPLDELVASIVAERDVGAIEIVGGEGTGKSTALAHLASVVSSGKPIIYLDDAAPMAVASAKAMRLVVYTINKPQPRHDDISFTLSSWREDEWIEYLLAVHHDRCKSVMARVATQVDQSLLGGNPELWRIVLDRMARDESVADIREMLRSELCVRLSDPSQYQTAREIALAMLQGMQDTFTRRAELVALGADVRALRLLRHNIVQRILATDRLLVALETGDNSAFDAMPRELIADTAREARNSPAAMNSLHTMLIADNPARQSIAASILHATGTGWMPRRGSRPCLERAQLEGVQWPWINLAGARLAHANLADADLSDAALGGIVATGCRLDGSRLPRADLTYATLGLASLEGADLGDATLSNADLRGGNLTSASFSAALLVKADLRGARIDGANFRQANLTSATLNRLPLRNADFAGAIFTKTSLVGCDMEGMRLSHADFQEANLSNALLTGSMLRRANLRRARLRGAGLADIDWEGADLRDADLRESSFYLGSSRSGLVGSPLACEGSRMGFYTDDYDQQTYKSPEEIRKANLRGADLRGAKIKGVDFYLVDLRDAKYTPDQAEQLRRCGAILFERAAS